MGKEQFKPDNRLTNIADTEDASTTKDSEKLVEVKKKDTGEDKDNEFVIREKPSDEQMHELPNESPNEGSD